MLMSFSMSFTHRLLFTCSCAYEQWMDYLHEFCWICFACSVVHVVSGLQLCSCSMGVAVGQPNNILSFYLAGVVRSNEEEEEEEEEVRIKGQHCILFCRLNTQELRTYYFSADSQKEQEEWIQTMSKAARVHIQATSRYTHIYNPH